MDQAQNRGFPTSDALPPTPTRPFNTQNIPSSSSSSTQQQHNNDTLSSSDSSQPPYHRSASIVSFLSEYWSPGSRASPENDPNMKHKTQVRPGKIARTKSILSVLSWSPSAQVQIANSEAISEITNDSNRNHNHNNGDDEPSRHIGATSTRRNQGLSVLLSNADWENIRRISFYLLLILVIPILTAILGNYFRPSHQAYPPVESHSGSLDIAYALRSMLGKDAPSIHSLQAFNNYDASSVSVLETAKESGFMASLPKSFVAPVSPCIQSLNNHISATQNLQTWSKFCQLDYILGDELFSRIIQLAHWTDEPGIMSRPYLSKADAQAALQIKLWMEDAGMSVRIDIVGNVIGRFSATTTTSNPDIPPKVLLLGSHFDTVRNGGLFDGIYGVLTSIAVVKALHISRTEIPFDIVVLAFDDEEGHNPFGTTNLGAKTLAGLLGDPHSVFENAPGLLEALAKRMDAAKLPSSKSAISAALVDAAIDRSSLFGYLEVHIEQGPVLENENLPVGVVTSINGQTRGIFNITGHAGHAGTVPMNLRADALVAAAQAIQLIEAVALNYPNMVATVGVLEARPGSTNVIPAYCTFSLDLRSPNDDHRQKALQEIITGIENITAQRAAERPNAPVKLKMDYQPKHSAKSVAMSPFLVEAFSDAAVSLGYSRVSIPTTASSATDQLSESSKTVDTAPNTDLAPPPPPPPITALKLPSGAGHDAMIIAEITQVAMLFVRCRGGISHNPAEWVDKPDSTAGAKVLMKTIQHIASIHN